MEEHPGARVAHHLDDPPAHCRIVAVHVALRTKALAFPEGAVIQPPPAIVQELLTIRTERPFMLLPPAVDPDHLFHDVFLPLDSAFRHHFAPLVFRATGLFRPLYHSSNLPSTRLPPAPGPA